jgi:hypothetical protein
MFRKAATSQNCRVSFAFHTLFHYSEADCPDASPAVKADVLTCAIVHIRPASNFSAVRLSLLLVASGASNSSVERERKNDRLPVFVT